MPSAISIGEAAYRSGCTVATIRFYEETGLIPKAARTGGGRWAFSRPDIERLRLIRRLRSMEFGIDAIKELLAAINGAGTCMDVRDLAESQLQVVRARRAEMDALERTLQSLTGRCSAVCSQAPSLDCTIVFDLAGSA